MKSLSIHVTDMCNQSCKFCVVDSYQERKEQVDKRAIFKFLEENANQGYEIINIHGGEATILPDFIEILKKINKLGYTHVSLQTNARTLSDLEFAKQLVKLNVKKFVISFHTIDAQEMASLANVDETWLSEIIQGIRNVKHLGASVRTNTVLYKGNVHNAKETIQYLVEQLRVDHINISAMHPSGRAYKHFASVCPQLSSIIPLVQQIVDYVTQSGVVVTLEGFQPCMLGEYRQYIIDWKQLDIKMLYHNFILPDYANFMSSQTRILGDMCTNCALKTDKLCGGIYKEYVEHFGWDEFKNVSPISKS